MPRTTIAIHAPGDLAPGTTLLASLPAPRTAPVRWTYGAPVASRSAPIAYGPGDVIAMRSIARG